MLKIFLITLFASVVFTLSDKCEEAGIETCRSDEYYKKTNTMPETAEELEAYCEYNLKYFECRLEVQSECENDTDDAVERWRESISVNKQMCNNETILYKNLLLVLPCLKYEIDEKEGFFCYSMYSDEPTLEKFEDFLNSAGITDVSKGQECFGKYFFHTCMIGSTAALCGTMARDVVLEIAELHIEARQDECNVKIKGKQIYSHMAPAMEILYLESKARLMSLHPEIEDTTEA